MGLSARMDSGLESKELRPSRGVHTHPTPNKEQMTFLRGSWRGPNKLPRFGDLLKWDRGGLIQDYQLLLCPLGILK